MFSGRYIFLGFLSLLLGSVAIAEDPYHPDYYARLGIFENSGPAAIYRGYIAMRDRYADDETALRSIEEAFMGVFFLDRRARYDASMGAPNYPKPTPAALVTQKASNTNWLALEAALIKGLGILSVAYILNSALDPAPYERLAAYTLSTLISVAAVEFTQRIDQIKAGCVSWLGRI